MNWYARAACLGLLIWIASVFSLSGTIDDLDHAGLEGEISDVSGAAIAGASVRLAGRTVGRETLVRADGRGRYIVRMLPPGIYDLTVEHPGFQPVRVTGIEVAAGATVRRDFRLNPASIAESMTVEASAESTAIDAARTVFGGSIQARQADGLPVESRNPLDLVFLLPGTSPPALSDRDLNEGDARTVYRRTPEESGIFSLAGGTPFSNNLTIEGMDNNDDRAARERFAPSVLAVDEVQVIANQYSAEYGRASGGRVNIRLRGGGERLSGQAQYFFRDAGLNANGFARNSDPARSARLPFRNHNPALSAGGPLAAGRIRVFGAWEHDYVSDMAEIRALVPVGTSRGLKLPAPNGAILGSTAAGKDGMRKTVNGGAEVGLYDETVATPKTAHSIQARGDFRPFGNHETFALLTLAANRDERGFPGGRRMLDTLRAGSRSSLSLAVSDNAVVSGTVFNNARFQYSRLRPRDAAANSAPVTLIEIDDPRDVIGDAGSNPASRSGTLLAGSSNSSGVERIERRMQLQDTLTLAGGTRTLRLGADLQAIDSRYTDLGDTTGTFTFASPADFLAGRPSRFVQRFFTGSRLRNLYSGLFAQGDWRARPGLNLSYGIRWDNETIIRDLDNLGPRVSFAWDPTGSARGVIRGGAGIFYNRAMLRTVDDYTVTSRAVRIDTNNEAARGLLQALDYPAALAASDPAVRQMGAREAGFLRRIGAGFRIPESYQASFGYERDIGGGFKVEIAYTFNRGLHLWREINANAPRLPAGFPDFTSYLLSRDFDNARSAATGQRPIAATGNADVVRFDLGTQTSSTIRENGRTVVVFGLNNPSTSNSSSALKAALAAVRGLRPNPELTQVEELQSPGNSLYHGLSIEVQRRLARGGSLRASYTLSRLIDDGVVNTSSPLVAGDFNRERARSLMDARHRIAISGIYRLPRRLGGLALSGIFNFTSSRPFNIGANGNDRNLDDVDNDRPLYGGNPGKIGWRRPGQPLPDELIDGFSLPPIGSVGNLTRNAGRGPAQHTLSSRLSRVFEMGDRRRIEIILEAFNPLNATVFSFGAEFVNFNPSSLGDFLVPRRTVKPRSMRVGLRLDF